MLRPRRAWPLHSASLAVRGPHHSGRSTQPPLRPAMPYAALASLLVQRLAPPHPPREPPRATPSEAPLCLLWATSLHPCLSAPRVASHSYRMEYGIDRVYWNIRVVRSFYILFLFYLKNDSTNGFGKHDLMESSFWKDKTNFTKLKSDPFSELTCKIGLALRLPP
jgi:hypothetical protein